MSRSFPRLTGAMCCTVALLGHGCVAEPEAAPDQADASVTVHEQAFRSITAWPVVSGPDHDDLTQSALSFMQEDELDDLGDEVEDPDTLNTARKSDSSFHFDNCRISETFTRISAAHETAVQALNPAAFDKGRALHALGVVLHAMQDFYAHSNWVDAGSTRLVSTGFALPKGLAGSVIEGFVVFRDDMPPQWTLAQKPNWFNDRVPRLFAGGVAHPGLITGTYEDNTDSSVCHSLASIEHGTDPNEWGSGSFGEFLAKDDPDSPNHQAAANMALRQTKEEFCRLDRLVTLRWGKLGHDSLLDAFVGNRAGFDAACPNNQAAVAGLISNATTML